MVLLAAAAVLLGGCVTLDRNAPRASSAALTGTEAGDTTLGRKWSAGAPEDPQLSAFRLLPDNLEAFAARVAMIDAAERTLDLQYYIFTDDETGLFIVDRLVAAADRGVRVRILVDDMCAHGIEKGLAAFDAHPQIELRIFNPWRQRTGVPARLAEFLATPRLNHRMHNKTIIADGVLAVLGGRNLADAYYDLNSEFNFRDLDVAIIGPAVAEANCLFARFWNGPNAVPVTGFRPAPDAAALFEAGRTRLVENRELMKNSAYAQAVLKTEFVEQLKSQSAHWVFAKGQVLGDAPDKPTRRHDQSGTQAFGNLVGEMFSSARRELLVSTPYFVPGPRGTKRLCDLAADGVDVRILTNTLASNDLAIVHSMYAKYRLRLVKGGVALFELRRRGAPFADGHVHKRAFGSVNSSLHAKTFVIDRERVFIGSLNLDLRSVVYNTEVGVLIESPELAQSVAESITALQSPEWSYQLVLTPGGGLNWVCTDGAGKELRFRHEPDTTWWGRLGNRFLGLLPIEGQT
jgi:putative cardiolipin synthase